MDRHADRFWEIDCLRGFAVFSMLLYHFLYDLDFFGIANIQIGSGLFLYIGRGAAFLFILISGTALSISHSRALDKEVDGVKTENFLKYLKRGLKLFSMGLVVTAITWTFFPKQYIIFGILHFFGGFCSACISLLELRKGKSVFQPVFWSYGDSISGIKLLVFLLCSGWASRPITSQLLIISPYSHGLEYCLQEFSLGTPCIRVEKGDLKSQKPGKIPFPGLFPLSDSTLWLYILYISRFFSRFYS